MLLDTRGRGWKPKDAAGRTQAAERPRFDKDRGRDQLGDGRIHPIASEGRAVIMTGKVLTTARMRHTWSRMPQTQVHERRSAEPNLMNLHVGSVAPMFSDPFRQVNYW